MKRLMVLSILIIVILLSFNSIGCQQKTESDTAPSPTTTPTPVPTPTPTTPTPSSEPTPAPTETGSTCDQKLLSYNIPLSFRKSGELITRAPYEPPNIEDASSEPQLWCFYHTPEALPTMRNYFKREMPKNGWGDGEWFDEVESSLSYWTSNDGADGAVVWMIPEEPGTFLALARSTNQ